MRKRPFLPETIINWKNCHTYIPEIAAAARIDVPDKGRPTAQGDALADPSAKDGAL